MDFFLLAKFDTIRISIVEVMSLTYSSYRFQTLGKNDGPFCWVASHPVGIWIQWNQPHSHCGVFVSDYLGYVAVYELVLVVIHHFAQHLWMLGEILDGVIGPQRCGDVTSRPQRRMPVQLGSITLPGTGLRLCNAQKSQFEGALHTSDWTTKNR